MARERYLVGVSKKELEYTPPPPPPSTPKGKWDNFWYHYKWAVIAAVFGIIVVTVLVVQVATKTRPDYTVCMVTQQELSLSATNRLQAEFAAVGEDRNGDGEVVVKLQVLNVSSKTGTQYAATNRQAVTAHIVARDVLLFAFDPEYYTTVLEPIMEDGVSFFTSLSLEAAGISKDGTYWNWENSSLLKEADMQAIDVWQAVPEGMYFGVRNITGNKSEQQEKAAHLELLKAFVAVHS